MTRRIAISVVAFAVGALALGCGGGPKRFPASGKATFDGQPIPAGTVYFDPDTKANPDVVQGYAPITNGEYDTNKKGKGTSGGAYTIRVTANAEPTGGDRDEPGKPLFAEYTEKVDLPQGEFKKDIAVPKSAATPKAAPPPQPAGERPA